MTSEQIALLSSAAEGHVLITPIGSANDILWGQLAEQGILEPADLPTELAAMPGLNWNAWRATEAGKLTLATDLH